VSHALEIIGSFLFGLIVGGGVIGAIIGWTVGSDEAVVKWAGAFFAGRPELLERTIQTAHLLRRLP